jgi:PhzF family phenazine biosynthesis protein
LDEAEMQLLAAQLKSFVNEVGFVTRENGQIRLRFYSSECEVEFCGHATIAILYDLIKNTPALINLPEMSIRVNAGELAVYNLIQQENAVFITAPAPQFMPCSLTPARVGAALGIEPHAINSKMPMRLIKGGLNTFLVQFKSLDACLQVGPEQEALKLFCLENGIDIVHIAVRAAFCPQAQYRTRVFAPKFGYLEDPATGSGNAAFGYYLLDEKLWNGDLTLEQGADRKNPNLVKLKKMELKGQTRILFGGSATTRIEGEYWLQ